MRKSLLALITATMMSVTFVAAANPLETHMQTLMKQYQVVTSTSDSAEFIKALEAMHEAAVASAEIMPDSLQGKAADSAEVKQYKQGYADLNAKIEEAISLAKQDKMEEAKVAAEALAEIRNANHKLFR